MGHMSECGLIKLDKHDFLRASKTGKLDFFEKCILRNIEEIQAKVEIVGFVLYSGFTRLVHWVNQGPGFGSRVFWLLCGAFLGLTKEQVII